MIQWGAYLRIPGRQLYLQQARELVPVKDYHCIRFKGLCSSSAVAFHRL